MDNLPFKLDFGMECIKASSGRPYVKIASKDGSSLYANFEFEIHKYDFQGKSLPGMGIAVRFASNGSSFQMKVREKGSSFDDEAIVTLDKKFFPFCLLGPVAYTDSVMKEKKILQRLHAWLQSIAAANGGELTLSEIALQEIFDKKSASVLDTDPVDCKFPNEAVQAPMLKGPEHDAG